MAMAGRPSKGRRRRNPFGGRSWVSGVEYTAHGAVQHLERAGPALVLDERRISTVADGALEELGHLFEDAGLAMGGPGTGQWGAVSCASAKLVMYLQSASAPSWSQGRAAARIATASSRIARAALSRLDTGSSSRQDVLAWRLVQHPAIARLIGVAYLAFFGRCRDLMRGRFVIEVHP